MQLVFNEELIISAIMDNEDASTVYLRKIGKETVGFPVVNNGKTSTFGCPEVDGHIDADKNDPDVSLSVTIKSKRQKTYYFKPEKQ